MSKGNETKRKTNSIYRRKPTAKMNGAAVPKSSSAIPAQNTTPPQENTTQNNNTPTAQVQSVRASPELQQYIQSMIQQALSNRNQPTQWTDETITDRTNLEELDKIPDIVRCLREFSGERNEYTAWRKSVDRVFELYGQLRGTAKYFGILSVIRNKIIGQANTALESYSTPLNWNAIKQCLNSHYADRRDIGTLEYQLTTMIQGNSTIESFYQRVYGHLSLIMNNISGIGHDKNTETEFINSYRNKALDTFIRGLNGDLPQLLAIREPTDLPQALHLCTKLANQNFRTGHANHRRFENIPHITRRNITNQRQTQPMFIRPNRPTIPHPNPLPRNTRFHQPINQPQYSFHQNQPNYSPLPTPFNIQTNQQQHNQTPSHPTNPKPKTFEPMDVDNNQRNQFTNYSNRPQTHNTIRRPNFHTKPNQPNFHINTSQPNEETFLEYAQEYEQQQQDQHYNPNYVDISDIHFLD